MEDSIWLIVAAADHQKKEIRNFVMINRRSRFLLAWLNPRLMVQLYLKWMDVQGFALLTSIHC
jgi:hypothetical protein